jgi:hypothetical protein
MGPPLSRRFGSAAKVSLDSRTQVRAVDHGVPGGLHRDLVVNAAGPEVAIVGLGEVAAVDRERDRRGQPNGCRSRNLL